MGDTITDQSIRVGVTGAGAMGRGIAFQVAISDGMELVWVVDLNRSAAEEAVALAERGFASTDFDSAIENAPIDVLVEATNSIGAAAEYCFKAIASNSHVVLMNAEVDLALRPLLDFKAKEAGVTVTSDGGDQHGVLAVMIEESYEMGFEVVQAGNIKGYLDRNATPESIAEEAAKRKLSATQCCAYTDGTKLHIEMAILASAYGYLPPDGGMKGPVAKNVQEALVKFDFTSYGDTPRIDYLLGAEPGGGVYLIVKVDERAPAEQAFYLQYYKLGDGPYYLLYRPYHLCHLETPKAIKRAVAGAPLLPTKEKSNEVYAYAKRNLDSGELLEEAIGSAECYGLVEPLDSSKVPIVLLENQYSIKKSLSKGRALTWEDIELSPSVLNGYWEEQCQLENSYNE